MYHCFVEAIAPALASSRPSGISGVSFNSVTSLPSSLAFASLEFFGISHQPANQLGKYRIGEKEINAEKRNGQCHHDRGRDHVRARRPVHLAHLDPYIVKKRTQTLPLRRGLAHRLHQRESADVLVVRFLFLIKLCRLRHFRNRLRIARFVFLSASCSELAGEEGFEPPLSVLETDGLPLNLLPFTLRTAIGGSKGLPWKTIPHVLLPKQPFQSPSRPFDRYALSGATDGLPSNLTRPRLNPASCKCQLFCPAPTLDRFL